MILELVAHRNDLSDNLFEHLTELAAEGWFKGAQRWQMLNQLPLRWKLLVSQSQSQPLNKSAMGN